MTAPVPPAPKAPARLPLKNPLPKVLPSLAIKPLASPPQQMPNGTSPDWADTDPSELPPLLPPTQQLSIEQRSSLGERRRAVAGGARASARLRSPWAMLFAVLVHALMLWLMLQHMPRLPWGGGHLGGEAGAPAFNFSFRPVATLVLIDETPQRASGEPVEASIKPTAEQRLLSTDARLVLQLSVTTTLPQMEPSPTPVDAAPSTAVNAARELPTSSAAPAQSERVTRINPSPAASAPAPQKLEGSDAPATPEPAAAPKPNVAAVPTNTPTPTPPPAPVPQPTINTLANAPTPQLTSVPRLETALRPQAEASQLQAPTVAALPLPVPPPATPRNTRSFSATAQVQSQPQLAPSIEITLSPNALPSNLRAPTVPNLPSVQPGPSLGQPPSNAVQVIVNVPVAGGAGLPGGLPPSFSTPGSAGAGGAGRGSAATPGTPSVGVGGTSGSSPSATTAASRASSSPSAAASRPLNLNLPYLSGPYADPRRRSLADLANQQLQQGLPTRTAVEQGVNSAKKVDCVGPTGQGGSVGGLLALPLLAWDAATGKCLPPK